ncbi:MAG: hypothetical protein KA248_06975 [Kiritimatiellae bacterium]|nr:hypothetical protein [Kiritimatiellia bacterium]
MKTNRFCRGVVLVAAIGLVGAPGWAGAGAAQADLDEALGWASDPSLWAGLKGARYISGISIKAGMADGSSAPVEKALEPPAAGDGPASPEIEDVVDWIQYDLSILVYASAEAAREGLGGLMAGERRVLAVGDEGYVGGGDGVLFPEGGEALSQGQRTAAFRVGRFNMLVQQDWLGRRELPEGPNPVQALLDYDFASLSAALAQFAAGAAVAPEYSALFDRLLALEAEGNTVEAIRLVPALYACDIPVDAFYSTLEDARARLLNRLVEQKQVVVGGWVMNLAVARDLFVTQELTKPDRLYRRVQTHGDLPADRYLYFMVVAGREPAASPAAPLSSPALPDFDPGPAVTNPDPWLVSAALFLARKGYGAVPVRPVLDRWASRRDLWDDICTEQALLFLAAQPGGPETVENENVTDVLRRLTPVAEDRAEAQALFVDYVSLQPVPPRGVRLESMKPGATEGSFEPADVKPVSGSEAFMPLAPGYHRFRYLDGAVHGTSRVFEAMPGSLVRVCTAVLGGP